ncbi:MAG: DUF456 domain-containing protein [Desulfovibrio sp.]
MDFILASIYTILMAGVLLLHIFTLPANWVLLGLVALWKVMFPLSFDWSFVLLLGGIAAIGEGIEFAGQFFGAKKYGASGKGNFGGVIGAIAGAILGAPFFFGLGALIGALAGAYGGCLLTERLSGRSMLEARSAALGAFYGKALGMTAKIGAGATMFAMAVPRIW